MNAKAFTLLISLGLVLFGCAGTPKTLSVVLDHQNKTYGKPVPDWVTTAPGVTEKRPDFVGQSVFRAQFQSADLTSARQLARGFDVKEQVVQSIGDTVTAKGRAVVSTLSDATVAQLRQTIESESQAFSIPPLREYDTFWELRQVGTQKPQYTYFILYTADKNQIDDLVNQVVLKAKVAFVDDPKAKAFLDGALESTEP